MIACDSPKGKEEDGHPVMAGKDKKGDGHPVMAERGGRVRVVLPRAEKGRGRESSCHS